MKITRTKKKAQNNTFRWRGFFSHFYLMALCFNVYPAKKKVDAFCPFLWLQFSLPTTVLSFALLVKCSFNLFTLSTALFFSLSLSIEVAYFSHPLNDIACVQRTRYDFQWLSVLCLQNLHWPHIFGVVKVPIKHGVEFFFSTMQKIDHLFQCLFKLE